MSKRRRCPECGADIPADAPEGLCRKCLVLVGIADLGLADVAESGFSPELHKTSASEPVEAEQQQLVGGTVTFRSFVPQLASGRYTAERFHARGGMGEVWLAKDEEIGRHVALKKLRNNEKLSQDRFLAEAQITGQLEHPGVVPVHDLGVDDKGQTFYVMKFIEGRTLQSAIDDFHSSNGVEPGKREVERRRLLECFLDLCDAVAYAHSRGVIHRDIKPDNVMLGPFGETLVVDWGLAKIIDQPEMPGLPSSSVALTSSGRSAETQVGSVVGTPAYMPPELADGHAAEVDATCDVYLLGATLYYMLTGQAPRRGSSHQEMVEMARTVPPPPPRTHNKEIPRALEAICLKMMAQRCSDRYPNAHEVGEELRRYLAGEPVIAYAEPLAARSWRWVKRRRRPIAWSLSAAAMLGLIACCSAMLVRMRRSEAINLAVTQVDSFRKHSDEAFYLASSSDVPDEQFPYFDLPKAITATKTAIEIADDWGDGLQELPLVDRRENLKSELYELLLLAAQLKLHEPNESQVIEDTLAYLDQAKALSKPTQGFYRLQSQCLWAQAKGEEATASERQAEDLGTPATALDHFLRGEQHRTGDASLVALTDHVVELTRRRNLEPAIAEYLLAIESDPDHYWSLLQLGRCRLGSKDPDQISEGIGILGACVALRPDSPWGYSARGAALGVAGRYSDALVDLNRALDKDPAFLPAKLQRGFVFWRQGETQKAIDDLQEVWKTPDDSRLVPAAFYLGQIYLNERQYDRAADYLSQYVAIDASFRPALHELAHAEFLRGNATRGRNRLNQFLALGSDSWFEPSSAEAHLQRGRFLRLLATNPRTPATSRAELLDLALAEFKQVDEPDRTTDFYYNVGIALEDSGQYRQALAAFSSGLRLDPEHTGLLNRRGRIYFLSNQYDKARQDYSQSVGQRPKGREEQILVPDAQAMLGCIRAVQKDSRAARDVISALLAMRDMDRRSEYEYVVWHNLACVFGKLSEEGQQDREEMQGLAIDFLEVAVNGARAADKLPYELRNIQAENFFGPLLRARPEFQKLLGDGQQK